jgi:hypothetical protein
MPVVMSMHWNGLTPEQYEAARAAVNWEGNEPNGGKVHISWFEDGALRVVDVWDSAEAFNAFASERLMPGIAHLDFPGEPQVSITPAHAMFIAKSAAGF